MMVQTLEKRVDVLLVKPNQDIANTIPPLGLGYLATALEKENISVSILDSLKEALRLEKTLEKIVMIKPGIIGITCCSNEFPWVKQLAQKIRNKTDAKVIIGGPHITGIKREILTHNSEFDYAVAGEGETALPEIAKLILDRKEAVQNLRNINNLIWRNDKDVVVNQITIQEDIDAFGFPAWHLINPENYPAKPHGGFSRYSPVAPIITTRGCPYPCKYCAGHLIQGKKIRFRKIENIIEEIKLLVNKHGIREIHIEDDNFTARKSFVVDLCEKILKTREIINKRISFSLPNGVRIDHLDDEILTLMKKCGFYSMVIGIESGSQRVLDIMGKKLDLRIVKSQIEKIKKHGFIVKGFFMLGYPGETKTDIERTITFSKQLNLDRAFFSVFIPLPGTPIYHELISNNEIDPAFAKWESYYTGKLIDIPYSPKDISKDELRQFIIKANRSFYLRPKIIYRLSREINNITQIKFLINRALSLAFQIHSKKVQS